MQVRTKQGLQTLRRVQSFLGSQQYTVAMGDLVPQTKSLDLLVTRLEEHVTEQGARDRHALESTRRKNVLKDALRREYLRPIAQLAVSLFPEDLTLREAFRLPKGRDDEGLLQAANAVAERAEAHQAAFVGGGLAADFVERLRGATAAYREALIARGMEVSRRTAATAGMLQELARGRELVRLLDTMLAPRLATTHDLLAEWRSVTRFVRPGAREVGVVVPVGPPAPAPTPVSTGGGTTNPSATPIVPVAQEVKAA